MPRSCNVRDGLSSALVAVFFHTYAGSMLSSLAASAVWIWLSGLAFAVIHSGTAAPACKRWLKRCGIGAQRYRLIYSVVSVVLTGAWLAFVHALPDAPLYRIGGVAMGAMVTLQLVGLGIALASFTAFDARMFLGLAAMPESGEPFHERGIYRHIRHPMYSGTMLALWASPVQSVNSINLFACISLYFIIGSRLEEARMLAAHPAYADYRRRVGAFIPRFGRRV